MARLKAPLMSLGARGQLAKSLIFSVWKGIDYAKEYAVPSNPNSAGQQTQRGYFSDAVDVWHDGNFSDDDFSAWNLAARYASKAMSGFNKLVKSYIDVLVAGDAWIKIYDVTASDDGDDVDIEATCNLLAGGTNKCYYGTSPTSLINNIALNNAGGTLTGTITAPGSGVKLYYKIVCTDAGKEGTSGIYSHTHA